MKANDFKRFLLAFADARADIDIGKGKLLVQVGGELIEASIALRDGVLWVTEHDRQLQAEQWLLSRVARLSTLADRIIEYVGAEKHFVEPSGSLTDELDRCPNDEGTRVDSSLQSLLELLSRRPGGCCWVVYLTSDAGEGKTTLINALARMQAEAYKRKETDWLLLPVSLGGKNFLRLDDVITGTLVNRLRFPMYFDAFLELVRMGVVIPALDGFEEMFVEGVAGDAVSALGNLLGTLESEGSLLIAARKALFEYKALETQAKLHDSLGSVSVAFARLAVERWSEAQFITYCRLRGVANPENLHALVAARLRPDHPLLTRAVLVKRLVDLTLEADDLPDLARQLGQGADYFARFVSTFIEREVQLKWIDRSGEPAHPLLTVEEHHELLAMVAREIWRTSVGALRADILETVADVFSEGKRKPLAVARQIRERISSHALLLPVDSGRSITFDHEDFYHYFLGWGLAELLVAGNRDESRIILTVGPLPEIAADSAFAYLGAKTVDLCTTIDHLVRICSADGPTSFIRENCGRLVSTMLGDPKVKGSIISDLTFSPGALDRRTIEDVRFKNCSFQPTELDETSLVNCHFTTCDFERLSLAATTSLRDVSFDNCRVRCLLSADSQTPIYSPSTIDSVLARSGVQFAVPPQPAPQAIEPDDDLKLVERILRAFYRASEVNENVFRQRAGRYSNHFFNALVPELVRVGVLVEVPYRGGGVQRRFRMGIQMSEMLLLYRECEGRFSAFIDAVARRHRPTDE